MRKPSSVIMSLLLLISMCAVVVSDVQVEVTSSVRPPDKERAMVSVIEHKITAGELERLKQAVGTWDQHLDYNRRINGHGTGLCPPTEETWNQIMMNLYVVERILIHQTTQSPSSVDHTTEPWFPPVGNQDGEGSCTAWAVGYYMKTFQEAKEHGWDLSEAEWHGGYLGHPTPAYQDRIISPDFIYHLTNDGVDGGSSFYDAINLVCTIGASSWTAMPYAPTDSTSWPSEEAWREAPLYRGNSSATEYLELGTDADLISLKNWIGSDHLAVIGVDADQYSGLTSKDVWTLDNYVSPVVNHANTVVGYDDNITYTEDGEPRQGAFKIANSWGEGFTGESIPDGYYWISYETMKQRVLSCWFYRDRLGYAPKAVASFQVDYSKRGDCDISIGVGNRSDPLAAKSFSDLINGGDQPFCANNVILDVTEFGDATPSVLSETFFLRARTGVPPAHSGLYEWFSDGGSYSWFRLTQAFDIPETGATLKFWSYYEIEEDWDYGYVEVHDLDAEAWFTLPGRRTGSTLPERQNNPHCPPEFEPTAYYDAGSWNAFTGFSGDSYEEAMDLTPFANHTIELCFTYWTDPYVLELGWFIDDIEIPEIAFFDDVESGSNGWTSNGWSITTPPPSTNGTLLSFSVEHYHNYSSRALNAKAVSADTPSSITNQSVFARAHVGDIDGDGVVNVVDLTIVSLAYGKFKGELGYDPEADLNEDDIVDMKDVFTVARHLGETDP